jgi:DNA-directed RNA polymerase III subunit RPC7
MSFRGGRGGARGGMLKGATWEHDPTIKLESAPSELFPVRTSPPPLLSHLSNP